MTPVLAPLTPRDRFVGVLGLLGVLGCLAFWGAGLVRLCCT